jgi:hypothetical protein
MPLIEFLAQGLFDHGANDEKSFGHGRKALNYDTQKIRLRQNPGIRTALPELGRWC